MNELVERLKHYAQLCDKLDTLTKQDVTVNKKLVGGSKTGMRRAILSTSLSKQGIFEVVLREDDLTFYTSTQVKTINLTHQLAKVLATSDIDALEYYTISGVIKDEDYQLISSLIKII